MKTETTTNEQIETLLRELVQSISFRTEDVQVVRNEVASGVYWNVRTHAEDMGKVLGRDKSHVNALSLIVREAAKFLGSQKNNRIKILDPEPAMFDERSSKKAQSYDPTPASKLLEETLLAVGVEEHRVECAPMGTDFDGTLRFDFMIRVRSEEDYKLLTVALRPDGNETIIGAVGTLLRAGARRDGIKAFLTVSKN